ncbi:MAG: toll/interleukin-1 receptor domain-containing protein [Anaerolineales bacterium]
MPEPAKPLRIFLSYAHADFVSVGKLYDYLHEKGFDVWFDKKSLMPGQDWQLEIKRGLDYSDVVIICLSQAAVSKEGFVQKEIKFALERALKMPEERIFLIPVRLQDCEVPAHLSRYQWQDLFEREGYLHLMRGLKHCAEQLERAYVDESQPVSILGSELNPGASVSAGKDVRGNIIVGNNNVVNVTPVIQAQAEIEKPAGPKVEEEKAFPKDDTHSERFRTLPNRFPDLQAAHEELVHKAQSSEEILEQVQQYLKDIQSGSTQVSSARERAQLRAYLRYWTSYVHEKTKEYPKEYPNVGLFPSVLHPKKGHRVLFSLVGGALLLLFLFVLGYFSFNLGNSLDPNLVAYVKQTQTATMWTPAPVIPSATPVPNEAAIVSALNDELQREADPLEEALDIKFSIIDIGFDMSGNPPVTTTMSVQVKCEWVTTPTCSTERALIAFARAFKGAKAGVRKKIMEQIPTTIRVVQVRAFDHMNQIGIIEFGWEYILAFANGNITGDQLAARIVRLTP